jgi:hypothetical protein
MSDNATDKGRLLFNISRNGSKPPGASPLSMCVVGGGAPSLQRPWDVPTHQQIGAPLTGHTDVVDSVAFSPDGKTFGTSWFALRRQGQRFAARSASGCVWRGAAADSSKLRPCVPRFTGELQLGRIRSRCRWRWSSSSGAGPQHPRDQETHHGDPFVMFLASVGSMGLTFRAARRSMRSRCAGAEGQPSV